MSQKKILIVEDDDTIREYLKELMEFEGYAVETAANGELGIQTLRVSSPPPNLILLDMAMPVKDGFQFRSEQLQDSALAQIPVVVMTADGHIDIKKKKVNAKDAIGKPFNINDIIAIVQRNCQ